MAAMRLSHLIGPDLRTALESDPDSIGEALADFHPEDIAELVEDLDLQDAVGLLRALPADRGADVIERLSNQRQVLVLDAIDTKRAVDLLGEMDPDDRVDLLQELPQDESDALLARLSISAPSAAEEVRELGAYGPETAGGLMTTEFVALDPDTKIWEAVDELRRLGEEGSAETIYYIYVCNNEQRLLGVVSLRDVILCDPGRALSDLMREKIVRVSPGDDQEKVAHEIAKYDLSAIPVVDDFSKLLGVVTIDDVVDVVIEEATEDAQMMGGIVPLEDSYFQTSWAEFVWKRGIWLVVLFVGQLLTATVMQQNADALRSTIDLVIFIPLIIASGGNAGSQSATLIIRAMAVGELEPRDWARVFVRELAIGLSLGIALGAMGFARAAVAGTSVDPIGLAVAVGTSILAIVSLSTIIGSILPLIIRRAGLDPAVSSTPFIASVVDVMGLVVYFAVAQAVLNSML